LGITITINKDEMDKLNKVIGLDYPETTVKVIKEEEDWLAIELGNSNNDALIETLFEDFDTIVIVELIGGEEIEE
jgi:hypothetical protein